MIDVESAVPNVSRRQALQADVTDVLQRAKAGTHVQIVQHLDNLAKGLLIDKLRFLGTCISLYGSEVLRDSSVPWIGSLRLPGTVELLSSREFLVQLATKSSLFIAFGAEPWSAMRKWVGDRRPSLDAEIAIALDGTGEDPNYRINDDTQRGTLAELLPSYTRTSLLNFILLLAAEAWQMNLAEFGQQDDWEHHRDVISGWLTRK